MISLRGKEVLELFSGQMVLEALFLVLGPVRFACDFLSWKGDSGGVCWPDGAGDPFPGFGTLSFHL